MLTVGATENQRDNDGDDRTYRMTSGTQFNHASFDSLAGGDSDGYTQSDDPDQMALFSSRGPVNYNPPGPAARGPTGRIKPDVVAPGTNIISLRSSQVPPSGDVTDSRTEDVNLYQVFSGTSMATPHTAGASLLVRQFYRARFGLMRRSIRLEGVAPEISPPPDFVDLPTVAPHVDGVIFAWVTPEAPPNPKRIVGSVFSSDTTQLNPNLLQLQDNVGDHPAPMLARIGDHTLLLHRHSDGSLRLSRYQKNPAPPYNLSLDTGFNGTGTVAVSSNVSASDEQPPAMVVAGSDVAVVWCDSGSNELQWRAFDAANGSAHGTGPDVLGNIARTSPHPYIVHNGTNYAVAWINEAGSNRSVLFRLVGVGTSPGVVWSGNTEIRTCHLVWDARSNRFVIVW